MHLASWHIQWAAYKLLHYNDFSTINVYATLFWLLGNAFVIVFSHANVTCAKWIETRSAYSDKVFKCKMFKCC